MKNKFRPGDYVIGSTDKYSMTNSKVVCRVVRCINQECHEPRIIVKPIKVICSEEQYNEHARLGGLQNWKEVNLCIKSPNIMFPVMVSHFIPYTGEDVVLVEVC